MRVMPVVENSIRQNITKEMNIFETTGVMSSNLKSIFDSLKSIPPTSTESERVFSLAGNIVTVRRQRLSDSNINMISFLKSYFMRN